MIRSTGLASVICNVVQVPPKFDSTLLRVSQTSPPSQVPNSPRVQSYHLHTHPTYSAGCSHRAHYSRIACSRGTEQEEGLSISEGAISSSQSSGGISNVETSHSTPSSIQKEKKSEPENHVSSIRTVALCVFTAVAFGLGLGFKDGVGKASEFFAGYLLEQSLSVDNLFVFVLIFKYFKVPIMYQM
ncbi:thylakoid membrane protein TERC, chloroplastic-like [Actinidia eriantha]|uniref:thylakoid membrane protein TERC, chloroplastic-like n=1 Tax=Actinidia eriantha TaxID=165200 RepID=UPI0025889920|nr:thylakoid membrane protein TERC, chloroplastic-like [Actinidia eriantha]